MRPGRIIEPLKLSKKRNADAAASSDRVRSASDRGGGSKLKKR